MTSQSQTGPEEHRFPCENCGADYRFAPGEGKLICDFCGFSEEIEPAGPWNSAIRELDFLVRKACNAHAPLEKRGGLLRENTGATAL